MNKKISYKIQNWSNYNQSLINRGNLTLWFSDDAIDNWVAEHEGKRGRPNFYSDQAILLALTLRSLLSLTLRSSQGFLEGLFSMMGICLPVPNYTRLCRRSKTLNVDYRLKHRSGACSGAIDVVVDSTGLKVYGEGEWKMKIHGKDKRRTWRKLHLAINPATFEVVAMELTESNKADGNLLPRLLKEIPKIDKAYGDAAYMFKECFDAIDEKGGRALIDLRSGTSIAKNPSPGLLQRNKIVREIWACGSCKKTWKKEVGYHRRSLVETQMSRLKKILGQHLSSKLMATQKVEARIKCLILNTMSSLGMPETKAIAA